MRHYQDKQEPVQSPLSSGERFVFTGFPNINVPATRLQLNLMSVRSHIFTVSSISYITLPPKYVIRTHAITNGPKCRKETDLVLISCQADVC